MDEMQAAILRVKLPYLDQWNNARRSIATTYNNAFKDLPMQRPSSLGDDYVAHLYVVRCNERDSFRKFLKEKKIATDIHYPIPDHLQPAYSQTQRLYLPITEKACLSILSLPCYPGLDDSERDRVIASVQEFFIK